MKKEDALLDRERAIALLSAYDSLLTDKQRELMGSYYLYDLSLSEISQSEGISRAAVSEALKKGLKKMEGFEEKLGLVKLEGSLKTASSIKDDKERLRAYDEIVKEISHGI